MVLVYDSLPNADYCYVFRCHSVQQLIDLLTLSEQYLLLPLKHLCEVAAQNVLSVGNV